MALTQLLSYLFIPEETKKQKQQNWTTAQFSSLFLIKIKNQKTKIKNKMKNHTNSIPSSSSTATISHFPKLSKTSSIWILLLIQVNPKRIFFFLYYLNFSNANSLSWYWIGADIPYTVQKIYNFRSCSCSTRNGLISWVD